MNSEYLGKLFDFFQSRTPQPSFDHADVGAAGHVREIFLGHSSDRSEFLKALCKGLSRIHGVIPLDRDDQLIALNTIALQTIVFI